MLREVLRREILDGEMMPEDRAAELRDIDRLSAWFGGHALTLRKISKIASDRSGDVPFLVADVGGGTAGLASRLARRERVPLRVIVVDRDHDALTAGREAARGCRDLHFVCADAAALPLRQKSVDIVTASLLLHHMVPDGVVAVLREMGRVARHALVVNDLLRNRTALALVWLGTRLFAKTRMARHDGPLSVRRAYSAEEIQSFGRAAGFTRMSVRSYRVLARLIAVMS